MPPRRKAAANNRAVKASRGRGRPRAVATGLSVQDNMDSDTSQTVPPANIPVPTGLAGKRRRTDPGTSTAPSNQHDMTVPTGLDVTSGDMPPQCTPPFDTTHLIQGSDY